MLTFQTAKVQQRHCTSLLSPLLPRVRVRCPRLRPALTFSPGTVARLFTGKEVEEDGKAAIGAFGGVTAELVSGNRHHAYFLNSGAFGIIVTLSLLEGTALPYKSLRTFPDLARLIRIYGSPNVHFWSICVFFFGWKGKLRVSGQRLSGSFPPPASGTASNSFIALTLHEIKVPMDRISEQTRQSIEAIIRWKVPRLPHSSGA